MKKNLSWKTDELSVTFQLSVSGAGEFGHSHFGYIYIFSVMSLKRATSLSYANKINLSLSKSSHQNYAENNNYNN